jgi:hypothetical protein
MYREFIRRICCNTVDLDLDELDKVKHMNPITQKFLVRRKTIIGYLNTIIVIEIIISAMELVLMLAGTNIMSVLGGHTTIENEMYYIIAIWTNIIFLFVKFYFTKEWYDSWHVYNGTHDIKILIFIYTIYFIFTVFSYIRELNFIMLLNTVFCIVAVLHIFILKTTNIVDGIRLSREYKSISRVIRAMYNTTIIQCVGISWIFLKEYPFIILFMICYMFLITISLFISNPINEKIENGLSTICAIFLCIIEFQFDQNLFVSLDIYVNYVMMSLIM